MRELRHKTFSESDPKPEYMVGGPREAAQRFVEDLVNGDDRWSSWVMHPWQRIVSIAESSNADGLVVTVYYWE